MIHVDYKEVDMTSDYTLSDSPRVQRAKEVSLEVAQEMFNKAAALLSSDVPVFLVECTDERISMTVGPSWDELYQTQWSFTPGDVESFRQLLEYVNEHGHHLPRQA